MNPFKEALKLFGPNGENWIKDRPHDVRREVVPLSINQLAAFMVEDALSVVPTAMYNTKLIDTYCSIGALSAVCHHKVPTLDIRGILQKQLGYNSVPQWNDDPETKWEDVKHTFEICAKEWDAKHGE